MNVRKPVDFSAMYAVLGEILAQDLPQMEEVCAIGRAVSQRPEKGAAVAAAEYLQANFPERTGLSPRNVRRMRDFYRTYENDHSLLRLTMKIGWTLNVVIIEAELTRQDRKWYLEQARKQRWSKNELSAALAAGRHKESCVTDEKNERQNSPLPFADKCGTINQEKKKQMPCSRAIALWSMRQIQNAQHLFAKRLRLILKGPHWNIGRPTGAQTIFRMLRWKSMCWK